MQKFHMQGWSFTHNSLWIWKGYLAHCLGYNYSASLTSFMEYHLVSALWKIMCLKVGWTWKWKIFIVSVLRSEHKLWQNCWTCSNSNSEELGWWHCSQTGLCNRQSETVSTFWKTDWLKLVIRVKLIKYQYPLKRVSWANILLVWNIQQNKLCQSLDDAFISNSSQRSKEDITET